jgi:hypothetical protein
MDTATRTHFTAWLTNDPSCLDQPFMDLTIWQDTITGYRKGDLIGDVDLATGTDTLGYEEIPVWEMDPDKPDPTFYAVTKVPARDGDIADAQQEAKELLETAGWRIVGDWDVTPNAYTVTVERDA